MRAGPRVSLILGLLVAMGAASAALADPGDLCAKVGNDDHLRPYDPTLRPDFVRAYKYLNPKAKGTLGDPVLKAQAVYRCMNRKLMACFVGANLPCGKIDKASDNPGADAFCRAHPGSRDVPLFASGHESLFHFRCEGLRAVVSGPAWTLDARGFAKEVWAPLEVE